MLCSSDMQMILNIIITLLDLVKFFIPILLIIYCTIDIFKIIVSKKEDEIKKLRKDIFNKILYSVLIYLIPVLIPFILNIINNLIPMGYDNSWKDCWNFVEESKKN